MRFLTPRRRRLLSTWARLHLERLEDRTVPSTFSWKVDASGNWNLPSNWLLVAGPVGAGFPNAAGDSAQLGFAITVNRTITIPNGVTITVGNLQMNSSNNYSIAAAGSGRLVFDNPGIVGSNASLLAAGGGAHTISAPITLAETLEVTNQSTGVVTFSGAIGENRGGSLFGRGLFTDGTGTLRLSGSGDNTFTGNTTVQSGALELNKTPFVAAFGGDLVVGNGSGMASSAVARHLQSDNIPAASAVTVNADGLYNLNGQSDSFVTLVVTNGSVTVGAGVVDFAALTMTGGSITATGIGGIQVNGGVTVNASATGSIMSGGHIRLSGTPAFTIADGAAAIDLNIASPVQEGFFPSGLTKAGPGAMRLGGPGAYTGIATLSAGTLLVGDNTSLGTGPVAVNGGAFQADGAARTLANTLTLAGDFTVAGGNDFTFTGSGTLTGNRTITVTNVGATNFTGAIGQDAASRALTKAGAGNLLLSGAADNTYTGTTTVADGALLLNKPPGIAAISGDLVVGDGVGAAGSAVVQHQMSRNILSAASVTVNADGLYRLFGQSEDFGPLVINGGSVETGAGTLSISTLTMTGGSIIATGAGEIQFNDNVTINASATGSTISGGRVQLGNATRTFTVAHSTAAIDLDINSEIRQQAGTVGLTLAGPGTMRLDGTTSNTYTGLTTVTAGTLELNKIGAGSVAVAVPADLTINGGVAREVVNNQIADTAAVTVNAGGTFDLNGFSDTVGAVTVTGGTVTTGGAVAGRLAAGNTSFNAAASLAMKLVGATTSDRITVAGTVALGGTLQMSLASAVMLGTAITLIDNDLADAVAGTFTGLPQGAAVVVGGQSFTISYTGGTGNDVVLTRADPPRVTGTQINGGANQRSRVTDVGVTFSAQVTFATTPGAAFTLVRNSDMAAIAFTATASVVNGVTVVTLNNFTGTAAQFGSLADGRYTLTVLSAQVNAVGLALDGDGDGIPGGNYTFGDAQGLFRYYGDMNGDRRVDISDFGFFSLAFLQAPNYNAALDFNNDGRIDIADFGQFSVRYFTSLP